MALFSEELKTYLDDLVPARESQLAEMEEKAARNHFPIIGPASGQACYLIARMISATKIYEMGSGFGYSTAWFAKAVKENGGGEVQHVVWDEQLSGEAKEHLDQLGYSAIVQYTVGEAISSLGKQEELFDLIFCDVDKEAYPEAIQAAHNKLRKGGVLIVDNMLWGGRIFDPDDQSPATQGIRKASKMLTEEEQWNHSLLPIRDGLMVALKK